jgi:Flp pilus assembly secretin CpaC
MTIAEKIYSSQKRVMPSSLKRQMVAAFSVISLMLSFVPTVQADTVFLKGTAYQSGVTQKDLSVGTSEVVVSNAPIKRVAVTDPSVAGVRILSDTTALVLGRQIGKTTLLIWEGKDPSVRPTRFDITVRRDISDLIASLKLLDPNIHVDYVLVPAPQIAQSQPTRSNGAYTTSFRTSPETVGDPAPSVILNNSQAPEAASNGGGAAGAAGAGGGGGGVQERVILSGKVKSPDVVAKAFTITATYMGVDSNMKIVTRNGGVIVDQISSLLTETDASGGAVSGSQSLNRPASFTSNLKGNIGNGAIVSNGQGNIISFLEVTDRPQISVMIRFYEVSRGVTKQFGSNLAWAPNGGRGGVYGLGVGGNVPPASGTQTTAIPGGTTNQFQVPFSTGGAAGTFFSLFPRQNLAFTLQALEGRGEVKLLAEPNLVVMSGEPGKFVAGGEIPIQQAVSTLGAIGQQVTFETFGITLNLLPTITDNDSVLMNVNAQTRDLDPANPFIPPGSNLPAFKTRRADTQVEIDPNQVLIIGGLLNAKSLQNLDKMPFIGDIPILGALARSKNFTRDESELIIVLSPEIVRGANSSQVLKPLALDPQPRPGEFDFIPRHFDASKTSVSVAQPMGIQQRAPVDLSRPTTVNDLDHIYK